MKIYLLLPFAVLMFFVLGCSFINKFTGGSNNADNTSTANSSNDNAPAPPTEDTPESGNKFSDKKNLLAFASGTTFAKKPSEYYANAAGNWTALGLIDEVSQYGWAKRTSDGGVGETMVLEMGERNLLKTLSFDTKDTDADAAAKNIVVEISDTSATDGFEEVLTAELKDKTNDQIFELKKEVPGRWVRLTVKDNYGSQDYTEVMEMRGYGDQLTTTPVQNVSGTYKMDQYGDMHIKQDGTSVIGCYEFADGLIEGGVEDRVMRLSWTEADSEGKRKGGPAVMVFSADGKKLTGAYGLEGEKGFTGVWNGVKTSDDVGNCPHAPDLSKGNAAKDTIGSELKESGRAKVYGINFDFNSDVIRAESKPTLEQIVSLLKENSDWKMLVEGHTDNIGGEAFNKSLSEKRAKSVKDFLVAAGIDESRLTSTGSGMSKPVTENNSEFGRAQNRRVELVKE